MNRSEQDYLRRRVLGRAPAVDPIEPGLDHGLDLRLTRQRNGRLDLAFVDGVDCLTQSLRLALTTALGSDIFNIRFGFDGLNALAFEPDPLLARERVRVAVIRTLKADSRVRKILDVVVEDGTGDSRQRRGTLALRAEFETVTGDVMSLDLGRAVPRA